MGMLNMAKDKAVYDNLERFTLCTEDFYDSFPYHLRNKFEFVTAAGLLKSNHLDDKIFEQMLLALKDRGFMIIATQFSYLGDYWYDIAF